MNSNDFSHDTIVIGGGPGGYELAALLSSRDERVALIEARRLGGTCLNRGCIPTKTFAHAASILNAARESSKYGITFQSPKIEWVQLLARKDEVLNQLREGIELMLRNVEVINAMASLGAGGKVILDNGKELKARRVVIATGSVSSKLPIEGAEGTLDSDDLLSLPEVPKSIVIIGGGVIGMEFASIFNAFGAEVTIVEYCKEILPPFDKDIAKRLRTILASRGVNFSLNAEVTSITDDNTVNFTAKGKPASVSADIVAMAVGRRPNLPEGLESAGVESTKRGIMVNPETFETTAKGIYAIGDVNGLSMLAHSATAQARCVAGDKVNLDVIPSAVFTDPEAAMVGATEEQCKASEIKYRALKALYRSNGKAVSMDEDRGMLKLIYDPTELTIIGCHAVGPHAADLVQEAAVVMANGLTLKAISRTIHAHPTLSEILFNATESALANL